MVQIRGVEYTALHYSDRDLLTLAELFTRYSELGSGKAPSSTIGKVQEVREIERMMANILERIYPELAEKFIVGGAIALYFGELGAIIADLRDAVTNDPHIADGFDTLGVSPQQKAEYLSGLKGAISPQSEPVPVAQSLDPAAISELVMTIMQNPELAKALQSR